MDGPGPGCHRPCVNMTNVKFAGHKPCEHDAQTGHPASRDAPAASPINFIKLAYQLYKKQLFENNIVDFSYLQVEFLNMLLKNKDFLEKINNHFDYIMVDEYQDSNKIQEKILLSISKNKKNICVVGDEDQSIYRFRGASAENILNFSKHFNNDECKCIVLEENLS